MKIKGLENIMNHAKEAASKAKSSFKDSRAKFSGEKGYKGFHSYFEPKSIREEKNLKRAGVVLGVGGTYLVGKTVNDVFNPKEKEEVPLKEAQTKDVITESGLDRVKQHLSDNRGKYIGAGAVSGTVAGTKMASNGLFGVEAQDAVQKHLGKASLEMKKDAIYNSTKGDVDGSVEVLKRPDNWIGDRSKEHLIQDVYQKENIPLVGQVVGSKVLDNVANLDNKEGMRDFIIRNPGFSAQKFVELPLQYAKGAYDSVKEHFNESDNTIKINIKQILTESGYFK